MNAKQRSKRRNLVTVKSTDGTFIIYFGRMKANQAISFKANPWQIFKKEK